MIHKYFLSIILLSFTGILNAAVERLIIVGANGCIYGQCLSESEIKYGVNNIAWLVPIISLILN